jgi:hypothetical protein
MHREERRGFCNWRLGMAARKAIARMTDKEVEKWIKAQQKLYAAGELPQWKIKRLEAIEGWTWK